MGIELTTYSDGRAEYEAIQLTWQRVREILGRDHRGDPEDDEVLVAYLLEHGAPDWVRDAEGWIDEHGWGLIGPERGG